MTAPTLARSAGVLLHPTSLPGPFGIGDLGPAAERWVDTLADMRASWWQILPLGPTGSGDSPYQSFSAFAGNVSLLSPELLERDGLVGPSLWAGQHFRDDAVDYPRVNAFKAAVTREAWVGFRDGRAKHLRDAFDAFCAAEAHWLTDYALFMATRDSLNGAALADWPADVRRRHPAALAALELELADRVSEYKFGQFLFDRQWAGLKAYAAEKGVSLIGDAPIFVSGDSSDVWANPDEFLLDRDGRPTVVAGVPPDYFSEDGQHWGNPLYDWDRMAATGYAWWVARLRRALAQVDLIRLDHFRGFQAAWHIPAAETSAKKGKWVPGPGAKLFDRLAAELGGLPLIAEDLGLITPDVDALREGLGLPGMRVLQFALDGPANLYWPHNFEPNTVCYTGTHDNDTTNGWYASLTDRERWYVGEYLNKHVEAPCWDFIRLAWGSSAVLAVAPLQDVLGLGAEARMNKPGVAEGNWRWRFRADQLQKWQVERIAHMTWLFNRKPVVA